MKKEETQPEGITGGVSIMKKGEVQPKTYDHDEVLIASREYFGGDELAASVWANKYALKIPMGTSLKNHPTICIAGWQRNQRV